MSSPPHTPPHAAVDRRPAARRVVFLVALVVLAVLPALGAAASARSRTHPTPAADRTLDVVASEFAFDLPDTVAAGRVRLRLKNRGREMHVLELARLADGHSAEELAAHLAAHPSPPAWATFVGGPLAPPAGARSADLEVTLDLAPGRYALVCPIPSPDDHRSHMAKGMVRTLVVTPAPAPEVRTRASVSPALRTRNRAPSPRVVLDDYGFVLDPAWRAGRHVVRVENRAAQPHELVVFRLEPGKRAADVARWAAGALAGPPPGTVVAGTTALGRGQVVTLTVPLSRGAYALLCFLPDANDGRSHARHGMTRDLTIR